MSDTNPFDDDGRGLFDAAGPDSASDSAKAPNLVENPAKPADKPKAAEKPAAKKDAPTRRTKAEKLADDIAAARELLSDQGFRVVSPETEALEDALEDFSTETLTFDASVGELGVLSATSGQIVASIDQNQVSVPVLRVSIVGWVGTAPIEVSANDGVEDLIKVLHSLRRQALEHSTAE